MKSNDLPNVVAIPKEEKVRKTNRKGSILSRYEPHANERMSDILESKLTMFIAFLKESKADDL